jgi:glyoxylase I family protein
MPQIKGFHHAALTVTDAEASSRWYQNLLGMQEVMVAGDDDVSLRILAHPEAGIMLGLRQYSSGQADRFDEFRTGLDHLAFEVTSADELAAWEQKLTNAGIAYTPAVEMPIGSVVVFRDPDNIQLEFWLPASS